MRQDRRGIVYGLAAALWFGISAPLAKRLLDDASPQMLAGVLYAGAAIALAAVCVSVTAATRPSSLGGPPSPRRRDAQRRRHRTGLVVDRTRAGTRHHRVPLRNLEAPLTLLVALLFFREHLGRRSLAAAALIFGGATVLTLEPGRSEATVFGGAVDRRGLASAGPSTTTSRSR